MLSLFEGLFPDYFIVRGIVVNLDKKIVDTVELVMYFIDDDIVQMPALLPNCIVLGCIIKGEEFRDFHRHLIKEMEKVIKPFLKRALLNFTVSMLLRILFETLS